MNFWHPDLPRDMSEEEVDKFVEAYQAADKLAREPVKPSTWVYLDDSGDGSTSQQASSHLVMATCVFRSTEDMEHASRLVDQCAEKFGIKGEFKFSKTRKKVKDYFFDSMHEAKFSVRAICLDKQLIKSRKYTTNAPMMKGLAIAQLLDHGFGILQNSKVFIDGQDTKAFKIPDAAYFMDAANRKNPGAVAQVKFVDSHSNRLIQLADMHAGAINAHFRRDKPRLTHYIPTFQHRMRIPDGTLWHFK
ncbi:DUF3800 domain-containing protein [Brevibacterium linens]|nr:DUF3800 domain-containing protein [Brevibacterium linens]